MAEPPSQYGGDPLDAAGPAPPSQPTARKIFESSALIFVFLRLCIYLALAYGIGIILETALRILVRGPSSIYSPLSLMSGEAIGFAGVFVAAWIMALLEKRPFGAYGLPLRSAFGKAFWMGALLGMIEVSVVVGAIAAFGAYHFGAIAVQGTALAGWLVFWAAFFVVVGLYEEFQFRGYLQFTAAQALTFWPAAVILSVAFGLVHAGNPGESWAGVAGVIVTGLLWCFTLRRTGNLWLAVGMHAAFDFGESFVYSVPDSGLILPGHLSNATIAGPTWLTGGSVGPEASVFDFVVLILFFFAINRLYPAKPASSREGSTGS